LVGKISKSVCAELAKLGIANAQFDVKIENRMLDKRDGNANGAYVKLGRDFMMRRIPESILLSFTFQQMSVRI
jgi:hypothetical protein